MSRNDLFEDFSLVEFAARLVGTRPREILLNQILGLCFKQEKKKEQPKKEKEPEPVEELDAAEAALLEEPKSKDPFDSLPKGTFNMDDFKRFYSNEDEAKSIPYFWEKFDPENYSIWFGEYKYNEELTKVFMSCNLITGMFQRLDKMRKQAFASVCLWGEDNNSTISGVWVWRGQDLAFELSPDWQIDYDCYAWKKLDPSVAPENEFVFGETNKSQDFLRKFPLGKVPAYETADGQYLTESNAIAFYLANAELRGKTDLQQAEVWQWVNFADSELLPASCAWVFPLLGIMPFQKKVVERAKQDAAVALKVLNTKLTNVTFLVGDRISLADICVFCTLLHLFENVLDAAERANYVSLTRWFNTVLNQPQVKAVIPKFQLCTKPLEFDPAKYAEFVAKTGGGGDREEGQKKKQEKQFR
uniref:eEF-1B gamma n=1 Tax=Phlebotomus papatasi TaxID=29031 RepID=A0A1B0D7I9_PHLPP